MQPLENLLHRITWDPQFGNGRFALGYEDRMVPYEKVVSFASVRVDPDRPGMFSLRQEDGSVVHIPLHRVRTVYRDDEVIWQRKAGSAGG